MRSALLPPPLLVLLLLVPSGLGNNEPSSSPVTVATTISAVSHETTGKPQTLSSPQPTGPSETEKPTTAAIRPTTLQSMSPALPISQTTSKSNQEGGGLTTVRGEPTTKAPSSVRATSTPVETKEDTTASPSAAPGALGTQTPVFSSLTTEPLLSPSATTKFQEATTLPDASTPQTTLNPAASTHKSESPPSLTSATPVPGAFPYPVSTGTSVTSRTQPTENTSETPVPKSTVSVSSEHPPASVSSEGPPASFTSEGPSASATPEMVPRETTLVSESSTSFSTSPYSSHSEPPATTSEADIFSPIPNKITCQPDSYTTENLLILKIANFSVCDGVKDSRNHPLYTALCRAGKPSFNKDRDLCHVQLISQPEKQEVAVLNVSVQTHLQPKELYEVLKKRWDDLKALGVSNMTYGKESLDKDVEDRFSMPLIITIVCMAAFLLFVAALYGCFHQRFTQRKDQQRLTEELQTVENGYHDNPTLEVMETSSEMQEKKVANLNGELGDSWIVPLDNLTKDDLDQEEEDTHL
ncbi:podocalyxin [Antechinus flavipes]|uniref:podocalyxin n=1 Tax=Antechinus flavipes TaxID=38775 RepID=UPI0022361421|nr:podocalyxin [Antechinus flavipes]